MPKQTFSSPISLFINQSIIPFMKKQKMWIGLVLTLVLFAGFAALLLSKNINSGYLDFREGSALYTSWRLKQGVRLYTDIITSHPPLLYLYGAVLFFVSDSIIFVRWLHLVLYGIGIVLIYFITARSFRSVPLGILVSVSSLLLPISSSWWLSFSAESLQRILFLLLLLLLLPVRTLTLSRVIVIGVGCVLLFFLKYTSLPFIFMVAVVLYVFNKRFLSWFLLLVFGVTTVTVIVLTWVTHGEFFHQTLGIRFFIPFRSMDDTIRLLSSFVVNVLPFCILNSICAVFFIRKKQYDAWVLLLLPVMYTLNMVVVLFAGTFSTIYFPVEPFFFLGFFLFFIGLLFQKKEFIVKGAFRTVGICVFLIAGLICVNYIQSAETSLHTTNTKTEQITKEAVVLIEKTTVPSDVIAGSSYFAFLTKRRLAYELSDTFLAKMVIDHAYEEKRLLGLIERTQSDLKNKKIKIMIMNSPELSLNAYASPIKRNYNLLLSQNYLPFDVVMVYERK